jgi:hypothetical protein
MEMLDRVICRIGNYGNKTKNKKYHCPKFNRKIVERDNDDIN